MRLGWIAGVFGAVVLGVSCSATGGGASSETGATWRCFVNPSPEGKLCDCKFATDAELTKAGRDKSEFPLSSCPASNYKCCEARSKSEAYDGTESCTCWNPEDVPDCVGKARVVAACPAGTPSTGGGSGGSPNSSTGWCCGVSGGVCLCRNDQALPCSTPACPATHSCCISGPDPDGKHCSCYSGDYLSQVGMTCAERAEPGEAVVPSCPN